MEQSTSLKWYYKNKERILAAKKEYYLANKETCLKRSAAWIEENQERKKQLDKDWRVNNKAKINANNRKRKAAKKFRTPSWLTEIDFERMENEYKLAALLTKLTGQKWEVDHVVPLQGQFVSGLHVPSNLRAIPAFDNRSKHNQYDSLK